MINCFCLIVFAELDFVIENSVKSVVFLCKEWLNFQTILFILDDSDSWFKNLSNDYVCINLSWVLEFLNEKKKKNSIAFLYRKLTFIIIILALFEDLLLCQLKNTAIPLKPIHFLIKNKLILYLQVYMAEFPNGIIWFGSLWSLVWTS